MYLHSELKTTHNCLTAIPISRVHHKFYYYSFYNIFILLLINYFCGKIIYNIYIGKKNIYIVYLITIIKEDIKLKEKFEI